MAEDSRDVNESLARSAERISGWGPTPVGKTDIGNAPAGRPGSGRPNGFTTDERRRVIIKEGAGNCQSRCSGWAEEKILAPDGCKAIKLKALEKQQDVGIVSLINPGNKLGT